MNRRMVMGCVAAVCAGALAIGSLGAQTAKPGPGAAGPVIVVDTVKGTFEFQTFPKDAPKTVEHVLALVKRNFYNGQVFHRVESNFVIQWGDPQTRDHRLKANWGKGSSGKPIGVAEISRKHTYGAVAMAHAGDARQADSQMYVIIDRNGRSSLDGKYTVFGQVISGMNVALAIREGDMIKRVSVRAETAPATK